MWLVVSGALIGLSRRETLANEARIIEFADIGEINCVRKHLSQVKGGQLAWATKASAQAR